MSDSVRIVVCLKQVPDPDAPASSYKIDSETRTITVDGVPPVINPYDERSLELALRLKDENPDVHVTALCAGHKPARPVLLKALAVGADELIAIEGLDTNADAFVTALVLASIIKTMAFDIVLTSRQAADSNAGVVGLMLSEFLGIPAASWARKIIVDGDCLIVERAIGDEYEILRGGFPALVTVSQEAPPMRMPKLPELRKAKQKPFHQKKIEGLEIDGPLEKSLNCVRLEAPRRERSCNFIYADSANEAGAALMRMLLERGILD